MASYASLKTAQWELNESQKQLLARMSRESGLETRLDPPQEKTGQGLSLLISVMAHLVLLAFFVIGLNWASKEPAAFEAQLWSQLPAGSPPPPVEQPPPPPPATTT